jgi:hypothetical protein
VDHCQINKQAAQLPSKLPIRPNQPISDRKECNRTRELVGSLWLGYKSVEGAKNLAYMMVLLLATLLSA